MQSEDLRSLFSNQFDDYHNLPPPTQPELKRLDGIRAVVFDVYGTLVSSGAGDISFVEKVDRNVELAQLLQSSQFPWRVIHSKQDWFSDYLYSIEAAHIKAKSEGTLYPEIDILDIWDSLFRGWIQEDQIEWPAFDEQKDTWVRRFSVEFELKINPVAVMPGALDCIQQIKSAGLPMGIVSNAQFYTPIMLEALSGVAISDLGFDPRLCVWSYQEKIAKPDTALYAKLKENLSSFLNLKPASVLYIGNDMKKDVVPAKKLGFQTTLFAGDPVSLRTYPEDPICQQARPELILTHWDQLWPLIS